MKVKANRLAKVENKQRIVASSLYIPAPFFAFKLYSMVERGFAVRVPVDLDSTFLAK